MNKLKLNGSTGGFSRTMLFNLIMKILAVVHGSLHFLSPMMTDKQFGLVSVVLAVIITVGNEYYRTQTTGPLHSGDQL